MYIYISIHVVFSLSTNECIITEDKTSASNGLPSEKMEKNERLVGYALYYYTYSTWNGRALYVEDLFVREEHRSEHQ